MCSLPSNVTSNTYWGVWYYDYLKNTKIFGCPSLQRVPEGLIYNYSGQDPAKVIQQCGVWSESPLESQGSQHQYRLPASGIPLLHRSRRTPAGGRHGRQFPQQRHARRHESDAVSPGRQPFEATIGRSSDTTFATPTPTRRAGEPIFCGWTGTSPISKKRPETMCYSGGTRGTGSKQPPEVAGHWPAYQDSK